MQILSKSLKKRYSGFQKKLLFLIFSQDILQKKAGGAEEAGHSPRWPGLFGAQVRDAVGKRPGWNGENYLLKQIPYLDINTVDFSVIEGWLQHAEEIWRHLRVRNLFKSLYFLCVEKKLPKLKIRFWLKKLLTM